MDCGSFHSAGRRDRCSIEMRLGTRYGNEEQALLFVLLGAFCPSSDTDRLLSSIIPTGGGHTLTAVQTRGSSLR